MYRFGEQIIIEEDAKVPAKISKDGKKVKLQPGMDTKSFRKATKAVQSGEAIVKKEVILKEQQEDQNEDGWNLTHHQTFNVRETMRKLIVSIKDSELRQAAVLYVQQGNELPSDNLYQWANKTFKDNKGRIVMPVKVT